MTKSLCCGWIEKVLRGSIGAGEHRSGGAEGRGGGGQKGGEEGI